MSFLNFERVNQLNNCNMDKFVVRYKWICIANQMRRPNQNWIIYNNKYSMYFITLPNRPFYTGNCASHGYSRGYHLKLTVKFTRSSFHVIFTWGTIGSDRFIYKDIVKFLLFTIHRTMKIGCLLFVCIVAGSQARSVGKTRSKSSFLEDMR